MNVSKSIILILSTLLSTQLFAFRYQSVKTMLHEVDASNLADTSRASHLLQHRSLGMLSPGFVEAPNKNRIQQSSQNLEKLSTQGNDKNTKIEISTNGPTRRIRRPTMIRRPKLIGKSVEGAAMHAVAASRKRASTNQFKSKTSSTTGTKMPTKPQSNRDPTRARANAVGKTESNLIRPLARVHRVQEEERDEALTRVLDDFACLCSTARVQLGRLSFIQSKARLQLADIWWPQSLTQIIPKSVAGFLISIAPNAWNDVCALPPLPGGVFDIFIPTLARWIVALTPGLELLSVSSSSNQINKRIDSLLLCTDIRNIRGSKCCAITRISVLDSKSTRQRLPIVRSEGWILNLRRRPKTAQKVKRHAKMRSSYFTEKDSAGMDKVLADVHVSFNSHSCKFKQITPNNFSFVSILWFWIACSLISVHLWSKELLGCLTKGLILMTLFPLCRI